MTKLSDIDLMHYTRVGESNDGKVTFFSTNAVRVKGIQSGIEFEFEGVKSALDRSIPFNLSILTVMYNQTHPDTGLVCWTNTFYAETVRGWLSMSTQAHASLIARHLLAHLAKGTPEIWTKVLNISEETIVVGGQETPKQISFVPRMFDV